MMRYWTYFCLKNEHNTERATAQMAFQNKLLSEEQMHTYETHFKQGFARPHTNYKRFTHEQKKLLKKSLKKETNKGRRSSQQNKFRQR